jgi:S1-C subfamily serine protease
VRLLFLLPAAVLLSAAGMSAAPVPDGGTATVSTNPPGTVENSVVKVFATLRYPDVYRPWTKREPAEISGSGVVIEGKRILTNAHIALYASQVQVQGVESGDKISATIEAVEPGIDLAVLKLDDESFFDTHPPLPRAAAIPDVKDPVLVYGFPTGGSNLSITKGIVSRVEFTAYNFPVSGLRIQIDAAINPGNSGGPAVVGTKMIGLAFSRLGGNAENIGYIIPSEEIDLFLQGIVKGHYHGKPAMFDELQTLENPALRSFLRLDKSIHGIVVHEPFNKDPAYPLKVWDVITKIGDMPVDDEGMILVDGRLRLRFQYLIQKIARGGTVPLTLVRNGKLIAVQLPVSPEHPVLIPYLQGAYPSYFVYGPIAFSNATSDYVNSLGNVGNLLGAFGSPLATRRADKPAFPGERLVIVPSQLFPHKLGEGYSNPTAWVVKAVNGRSVANLGDLVGSLRDCRDQFVMIEFWGRGTESMVFRREEVLDATDDILADNGVRSQGSPDMMAIWNAKPSR